MRTVAVLELAERPDELRGLMEVLVSRAPA
jgi:hypothetical protein